MEPDDEDASPQDRALARHALANARRPVDGNPRAYSPGAGPVARAAPTPVAPSPLAPTAMPAAVSGTPPPLPVNAGAASAAVADAGPADAFEEPVTAEEPKPVKAKPRAMAPTPPKADLDPTKVPGLTEQEKLWAAGCHGAAIIGFAIFAPLVIWLVFKNDPEKSAYVAHHAKHAFITQTAALVIFLIVSIVTCGMGTFLIFPWMALEGYMAWLAYEGKKAGYPGMAAFEGVGGGKTF